MNPPPLDWPALANQRADRSTGRPGASTIATLARRLAQTRGTTIAFIDGPRQVTYAEVYDQGLRVATALRRLGLQPGEVISFQLPNWVEAAAVNLAAAIGGWVCNPIVPIYRDAELIAMLGDCRSRALFVPGTFRGVDYAAMAARVAEKLPALTHRIVVRGEEAGHTKPGEGALAYQALLADVDAPDTEWPQVDPDAVKLIMYTSGTTGPAKGVLHSHASLPLAVDAAIRQWGLAPGARMLMPSPVTHATGYCAGLELPFNNDMGTVLMDRWDAEEAVALIRRHQVAATIGATPFLQQLIEVGAGADRLPLQVFVCGGAAVPAELIRRAAACFEGYACRGYGATEAPLVTFGRRPGDSDELGATTDGVINGYRVRILDAEDRELPQGQEGEIVVHGDGMFLGYTDPAATRAAFTDDGFYRTGDLGVIGPGGTLTITGRKKDLIIRGGENISAKEIEDVLHTHPAIAEAAVVSGPSARMGESVVAYLRLRDADAAAPGVEQLAAFVTQAGLARQKCPEHVRTLADFPRTASGKVRKDQLRQMIRADLDSPISG